MPVVRAVSVTVMVPAYPVPTELRARTRLWPNRAWERDRAGCGVLPPMNLTSGLV